MSTGKGFTGPRARLMLGDVQVGYCVGISINEAVEYQPIDPIDTIHTVEHSEVAYRVNGTLDMVRIVGLPVSKQRMWNKLSDLIAGQAELTMIVEDSVTQEAMHTVFGWKPETKNFRVEGRTLAGENVTWVGQVAYDDYLALQADAV
jgi:hypothetical protein